MPAGIVHARPVRRFRRAYRLHRVVRRVPARLRRPGTAARIASVGVCVWFGLLFAALGVSFARSPLAFVAFELAAIAGLSGALCVMLRRHELAVALFAAMLATGQLTALALLA